MPGDQAPASRAGHPVQFAESCWEIRPDGNGVQPAARVHGKRHYGLQEMRRLALLQTAQRLGIRLDTAAAVLDASREQWHATVSEQIAELDELISRAEGAKEFLAHALNCPAEHPARECPY